MSYRGVWTCAAGLTCAAGVGLAVLELGPLVAGFVVLLMSGGAAIFLSVLPETTPPAGVVAGRALGIGSAILALPAIVRFSPYLALSAVLLLGLSAPFLAERVLPRLSASGADPDADLLQVWRRSYTELVRQHSPDAVLRIVQLRAACLDELERRDRAALEAWLESGANAWDGPRHPPGTAA